MGRNFSVRIMADLAPATGPDASAKRRVVNDFGQRGSLSIGSCADS